MQLVVNEAPMMAVEIKGKTGKLLGHQFSFGKGNKSATEIKAELKVANPLMKGKDLTKKVNEVLAGGKSLAEQCGTAFVQAAYQSGFVPDLGQMKRNTAVLRFKKVEAAPMARVISEERVAELIALGVTREKALELLA